MINHEKIHPEKIAYDRPSDKLLKFLKKYYNLRNYIPQNNNFVIFDEYFFNVNNNSSNPPLNTKAYNDYNYDNYDNYDKYDNTNSKYEKDNYQKKPNKCLIPTSSTNSFTKKRGKLIILNN